MALDTRRYNKRQQNTPDVNISAKTLPGIVLLVIGLLVVVVGGVLMAVLGSPSAELPVSARPVGVVGPVVLALGLAIMLIGLIVTVYLKNKKGAATGNARGGGGGGGGRAAAARVSVCHMSSADQQHGSTNPQYNEHAPSHYHSAPGGHGSDYAYGPPAPMQQRT